MTALRGLLKLPGLALAVRGHRLRDASEASSPAGPEGCLRNRPGRFLRFGSRDIDPGAPSELTGGTTRGRPEHSRDGTRPWAHATWRAGRLRLSGGPCGGRLGSGCGSRRQSEHLGGCRRGGACLASAAAAAVRAALASGAEGGASTLAVAASGGVAGLASPAASACAAAGGLGQDGWGWRRRLDSEWVAGLVSCVGAGAGAGAESATGTES